MCCILIHTYTHAALVAQGRARKSKQNNGQVVCSRKRESCTTRFNVQDTDGKAIVLLYTISTLKKFVLTILHHLCYMSFCSCPCSFCLFGSRQESMVVRVFSSSVIFTHKATGLTEGLHHYALALDISLLVVVLMIMVMVKSSVVVAEINDHNCHRWRTRSGRRKKKNQQGWKGSKEKRNPWVSQEFSCPLYLMYCTSLLREENETHFFFVWN